MTKIIAARLLTNFTFVLYRIPQWHLLLIFCYTELLLSLRASFFSLMLVILTQKYSKFSYYYTGKGCSTKVFFKKSRIYYSRLLWSGWSPTFRPNNGATTSRMMSQNHLKLYPKAVILWPNAHFFQKMLFAMFRKALFRNI